MIQGKTNSGFEFCIEKERVENYELVELLGEVDSNPILLPKVVRLFLGDEQTERFKNHLRDDKGFVSTEKLMNELLEIFKASNELKN